MVPVNNMAKIKVTVEEYVKGETQTSEVDSVSRESVHVHVYTSFACVPFTPVRHSNGRARLLKRWRF